MVKRKAGWIPFALGWVVLLVMLGVGIWAAMVVDARYTGAQVVIRPWLATYSAVLAGGTALGLLLVGDGALRSGRRAAGLIWMLGAGAAVAMAAGPSWLGAGPFPAGHWAVTAYTVLALLPGALRAAGAVAFGAALGPLGRPFTAVAVLDLLVCVYAWMQTPIEVLARVHPAEDTPALLAPAAMLAILALVIGPRFFDPGADEAA